RRHHEAANLGRRVINHSKTMAAGRDQSSVSWMSLMGPDAAIRFGRAARQLHPHQQTFATTIKSAHSGRSSDLRSLYFFGKNSGLGGSRSLTADPDGVTGLAPVVKAEKGSRPSN